jgi:hypothetical protein
MKTIHFLVFTLIATLGVAQNTDDANHKPNRNYSFKAYMQTFHAASPVFKNYGSNNNIGFYGYTQNYLGYSIAATMSAKRNSNYHQLELNNFSFSRMNSAIASDFSAKRFYGSIHYNYNINIRKKHQQEKPFQIYLALNTGMGYNFYKDNAERSQPYSIHSPSIISGVELKFQYQTKSSLFFEFGLPFKFEPDFTFFSNISPSQVTGGRNVFVGRNTFVPFINPRFAIGFNSKKISSINRTH